MARALIQVNGATTTAATVAIGSTVLLSNDDEGGETTYAWAFVDQPEGTADTISNPAIENPSFTPTKEGTYALRLVVNALLGTQAIGTAVVSVLDARTGERIPAASETVEASTAKGWGLATNRIFARTLHGTVDGNLVVAQTPGGISPGQIVRFTGVGTANTGTQAQFTIGQIAAALGTTEHRDRLGLLVDGVIAGDVGANKLVLVRLFGLVPFSSSGSPAVGDQVYLSNLGAAALTAGTVSRVIGYVVATSGGSYQWEIDSGVGLPDGAVTTAKLADGAVTSAKILNGTIATADIGANQITNALLATMAANTIKGSVAGGTPVDLTPAQVRGITGGVLLSAPIRLTGSGSSTFPAGTSVVVLDGIGGGGGGGGARGTAAPSSAAGGSSGVRLRTTIGTPGTPLANLNYSWSCGTGGAGGAGATPANGSNGNDTTVTINGTVYTMKGGGGGGSNNGAVQNSGALPTAPAAGTSGVVGESAYGPGGYSFVAGNQAWTSGHGGTTSLGTGGLPVGGTTAGNAGQGMGGGGSGGACGNGGQANGGAGADGGAWVTPFS